MNTTLLLIPAAKDTPASLVTLDAGDTLQHLQRLVGGYIEGKVLPDGSAVYVNEEGKILGLPFNERALTFLTQQGFGLAFEGDSVTGDMLVLGPADDSGYDTSVREEMVAAYEQTFGPVQR